MGQKQHMENYNNIKEAMELSSRILTFCDLQGADHYIGFSAVQNLYFQYCLSNFSLEEFKQMQKYFIKAFELGKCLQEDEDEDSN